MAGITAKIRNALYNLVVKLLFRAMDSYPVFAQTAPVGSVVTFHIHLTNKAGEKHQETQASCKVPLPLCHFV